MKSLGKSDPTYNTLLASHEPLAVQGIGSCARSKIPQSVLTSMVLVLKERTVWTRKTVDGPTVRWASAHSDLSRTCGELPCVGLQEMCLRRWSYKRIIELVMAQDAADSLFVRHGIFFC